MLGLQYLLLTLLHSTLLHSVSALSIVDLDGVQTKLTRLGSSLGGSGRRHRRGHTNAH